MPYRKKTRKIQKNKKRHRKTKRKSHRQRFLQRGGNTPDLKYTPPSGKSPIRVIISADKLSPNLEHLLQSCKDNHYEYEIVGINIPWKDFTTRMNNYVNGLNTCIKDKGPNSLVLLIDAYDTIIIKDAAKTEKIYNERQRKMPILFGAECFCYSNCHKDSLKWYDVHNIYGGRDNVIKTIITQYHDHMQSNKPVFINAGGLMGPASPLLEMFKEMLTYNNTDDQICAGMYAEKHPDKIDIDIEEKLFRNKFDNFDSVQQKKPDECTDDGPSFLHWPGTFKKENLTELLNQYCKKETTLKGGYKRNLKDITLAMLCWKSYKTIENTLTSYKTNGLFDLCKSIIFFQEIGQRERDIAKNYPFDKVLGSETNKHILQGFLELLKATDTPYFIFAECDFELIHDKSYTEGVLQDCLELLETKGVDFIKLRDREQPGEPLYSRIQLVGPDGKQLIKEGEYADHIEIPHDSLCQRHKLETLHFLKEPEKKFPGVFEIIQLAHKWYKCSDQHNVWGNNIFIAKTQFLKDRVLKVIRDHGMETSEDSIMENFLEKNLKGYTLAAGPGLFKHNRLDR